MLLDAQPHHALLVDEQVWLRERRQIIRGALGQLPSEQRQVIELAYISGLSQSAIADRTGEPLGTITTRAQLALRKLKDLLAARQIIDM